ncbi:hypothetical protein [Escherichia coli]|uniref:hypothetical protein n=1 Tax=Escherichia coli TaxID=562 RepID=UPI0012FE6F32|nr:hypothetical protein [Escherichia coli]MVV97809.1 hypothetical protein [Escherichia coli]MWP12158.1 hypothetical protein [Escherichia coli]
MKKLMIASAIAMAMAAGSAMAVTTNMGVQQNEIQFLGAVTEVTCNIDAVVDGAVNNVVQLGTVKKGEEGEVKNIVLKAKQGTTCAGLDTKTATIAFKGPLGDDGLKNDKGTATGAFVSLIAKNSKTQDLAVNKGQNAIEFTGNLVNTEGYKFEAKLDATTAAAAGTFDSALAYAVTYQ